MIIKNITFEQQAKTWKSCPEAARLGNSTFALGSLCEYFNFEAAGQTWKSGCEEIKFGNQGFEQGSSYENDALQACGQQPGNLEAKDL